MERDSLSESFNKGRLSEVLSNDEEVVLRETRRCLRDLLEGVVLGVLVEW